MDFQKALDKLLADTRYGLVIRNARRRTHSCLKCNKDFKGRSKYHQFCSRRCYSQFHRIPGFVKRYINWKD